MSDTPPPVPPVPPFPPPPPPAGDASQGFVVPPAPNPYAASAAPNPYAAANPYATNPYAPSGPYAPYGAQGYASAPRTNTLAIVGFILSFFVSVAGIICGHIALSQIKRTGEGGHGLALAGVIIGYVITGFWALYIIIVIVAILISIPAGYSSYSGS